MIKIENVRTGDDKTTLEVNASILEGTITLGMSFNVTFNSLLSMTVSIKRVEEIGSGRVCLILDCEDEDSAELVKQLNFEDETIIVTPNL